MPSGYIVAKLVFRQLRKQPVVWKIFLICALIGSVAPDFDLIYFYLWDHKQHHHHTYWPHYPIVWLSLLLINFLLLGLLPGLRKTLLYSAVFLFCGSIHLLLDTVVVGELGEHLDRVAITGKADDDVDGLAVLVL